MFLIKLECGHKVQTEVKLNLQYPTDVHYILCPSCRDLKGPERIPTAWSQVVSVNEMSNVPSEYAQVMPGDIMRVQPSVPRNRIRPFPYVTKRGQF